MNKAFVRESDVTDEFCPRCGAAGISVQRETLRAQLVEAAWPTLADPANFCPTPTCEVAYFDGFQRLALVTELRHPVYPKDPLAPLCPCFGLTANDVEQDLAEGVVTRTRACVQRAQSSEARCVECAPTGRPCVAEVQRYYMQRRQGGGR